MATDEEEERRARAKAHERDEARRKMKRPEDKPHSNKGVSTHATASAPHTAGRSAKNKKKASEGEQGAHPGKPKLK